MVTNDERRHRATKQWAKVAHLFISWLCIVKCKKHGDIQTCRADVESHSGTETRGAKVSPGIWATAAQGAEGSKASCESCTVFGSVATCEGVQEQGKPRRRLASMAMRTAEGCLEQQQRGEDRMSATKDAGHVPQRISTVLGPASFRQGGESAAAQLELINGRHNPGTVCSARLHSSTQCCESPCILHGRSTAVRCLPGGKPVLGSVLVMGGESRDGAHDRRGCECISGCDESEAWGGLHSHPILVSGEVKCYPLLDIEMEEEPAEQCVARGLHSQPVSGTGEVQLCPLLGAEEREVRTEQYLADKQMHDTVVTMVLSLPLLERERDNSVRDDAEGGRGRSSWRAFALGREAGPNRAASHRVEEVAVRFHWWGKGLGGVHHLARKGGQTPLEREPD